MLSRILRLALAATFGVALAAAPPAIAATRVAVVISGPVAPFVEATNAMRAVLARTVQPEILLFDLENSREKAAALRELLHNAEPALVITVGSLATAIVLAGPPPAPVVFSMVLYPEESGFLPAGDRPITGAALDIPADTQFATARRLLPNARRVGVVHSTAGTGRIVQAARAAAQKHGFELIARTVEGPSQTLGAVDGLLDEIDLLWTVADSRTLTAETTSGLLLAALRKRVPVFGLSAAQVRAGALIAISADYADVGTQTAELALRILRGEQAGQISSTSPRKIGIALNMRTAKHLGLAIDAALEREASEAVR